MSDNGAICRTLSDTYDEIGARHNCQMAVNVPDMINRQIKLILRPPIEVAALPPLVPRVLAAAFSLYSTRTLSRHEKKGALTAIRVGSQRVFYKREEFLRWLGIEPPEPAPAPAPPLEALLPRIGRPRGSKSKRKAARQNE